MEIVKKVIYSDKLKKFLYGPGGFLLRPAHTLLVNSMIGTLLITHRIQVGKLHHDELDQNVTAVIKTFLRPRTARRCIRTLRQNFGGKIIVADDSPAALKTRDSRVKVLHLPFNSGISVGRNRALELVDTPYTLLTDDDTVFTCATDWSIAYEYLEDHPEVDGVAATPIEIPRGYTVDTAAAPLFNGSLPPLRQSGELIDGYPVVLKAPNLFLARTDSLRSIGWDENLKLLEHRDFFSAASGKLVFVQSPDIPAYHARTPWNKKYNKYRNDTKKYSQYYTKKWAAIARGERKPQGH